MSGSKSEPRVVVVVSKYNHHTNALVATFRQSILDQYASDPLALSLRTDCDRCQAESGNRRRDIVDSDGGEHNMPDDSLWCIRVFGGAVDCDKRDRSNVEVSHACHEMTLIFLPERVF